MKIKKYIVISIIMLTGISCGRMTMPEIQSRKDASIQFSLDTKGFGDDERTFRVLMTRPSGIVLGNGTYCSMLITPGVTGTWLSPCRVDGDGRPLTSEGTIATSLDEADRASKYGFRYATPSSSAENLLLSVASPAVSLTDDKYYDWSPDKELYLSNAISVMYEGSWANYEYVFPAANDPSFLLLDRRAKFVVHIECGEQETADIQFVQLGHVTKACWYPHSGFSSSDYMRGLDDLFNCGGDEGLIKTLIRPGEGEQPVEGTNYWESEETYILPLDYSAEEFSGMRPKLTIGLGTNTQEPVLIPFSLSETIEPMKSYKLTLKVSKSHAEFILSATDWEDGGTWPTDDEETWSIVSAGDITLWDKLENEEELLTTGDWNNSWD